MGRATQGVRMINLEKRNDQIASVCKVNKEEMPEEKDFSEEGDLENTEIGEEEDENTENKDEQQEPMK
jgi:DNA gyrase subunit A